MLNDKERTFKESWGVSETFRVLVLYLIEHQGEFVSKDELKRITYTEIRRPRIQLYRQTKWKDKTGKWWRDKKHSLVRRTERDIELCVENGLIIPDNKEFKKQKIYKILNEIDLSKYL